MKIKIFSQSFVILLGLLTTNGWGQSSTSFNIVRSGFSNTAGTPKSASFELKETALGAITSGTASSSSFVLNGAMIITEVEDPNDLVGFPLPKEFFLQQNHPNPFNPETTIEYTLPEAAEVHIKIYNTLGQELRSIFYGKQDAGSYRMQWDGKDYQGRNLPSGVYVYRLVAGKFTDERKMVLVR